MMKSVGSVRSSGSTRGRLGALLVSVALGVSSPLLTATAAGTVKRGGKLLKKEAVFAKAAPATVLIIIPGQGKGSIGSGVIIEPSGLILTNAHVVESSPENVQVFLFNPKEKTLASTIQDYVKTHSPLVGKVVRRDPRSDLALVRLPTQAAGYPTIELGENDSLQIGQDVVAIGSPLGLTWTFTTGTVSALRNDKIQTETPLNHGNSGGPLLDLRARLVGINTSIRRDSQGPVFGFAIPVAIAQEFVHKWKTRPEPDLSLGPPALRLSKNPMPLLAIVMRQDIEKLRRLNKERSNRQTETAIQNDLSEVESLSERILSEDLTVGQLIPRFLVQLGNISQHNRGARDAAELPVQLQVEKAVEHLKQIAEEAK